MPFFAYKGRNARGDLVNGTLESASPGAAADQLFSTGITPLEIRPTSRPAGKPGEGWWQRLTAKPVRLMDLLLFSRQMYTLQKAGVPILRALAGLQKSTANRSFARALQEIRENLEGGRELSATLARMPHIFQPFYVAMVRVGESTGMLEEIFLRLFNHLDFERYMREQVRAAVRYPIIVVVVMSLALVIINIFVIPAFAKVFKGFKAELPLMTRMLIGFSDFMVAWWPVMLVALIAAVAGFTAWVSTARGRYAWDRFKLRIPVAGKIVLKATLARFARSLALATKSGVPIVDGLSMTAQVVENAYIAERIERMREGVERGESVLRTAMASGVFTPVVLQMIAVGEETGALDDLMREVADMYQRELEYELKNLSAQIEPILVVGLGILVLILALGVFLPIWDLGQAALKRR